jgi:hypothetical protein
MTIKLSKILKRDNTNISFHSNADSPDSILDKIESNLLEQNNILALTSEIDNDAYSKTVSFYFKKNEIHEVLKFLFLIMSNTDAIIERLEESKYHLENNITTEWKIDLNYPPDDS